MFLRDADARSKRRTHFLRNIADGVMDKRDQARELGLKGKRYSGEAMELGRARVYLPEVECKERGMTHPLRDRVLKDGDHQ